MRLVILGAPGSGKGTQTHHIAKKYNLKHVVVGDVVKDEIRNKTSLGKILYEYTSVGKFVPSEIVIDVLDKQIKNTKGFDGFIIDTAPINMQQKDAMKNIEIDAAVWLKIVNFDVIRNRILKRLICPKCKRVTSVDENSTNHCLHCGAELEKRYDDNIETVNKRIAQYEKETLPVIESFRQEGKLIEINAERSKKEVLNEIFEKINKFFEKSL